jgi:predicted transglutaminase-like cysteine proteinase
MNDPVDSSNQISFDLDEKKKIQVREFNKKVYVDIRDFYMKENGQSAPSRKGISLTVDNWEKFLGVIEEVNKAIA